MINVVSFAKPKEGKSTGSTGRSGFASTVVYNGGVEKHTLWGQSYNGRNDVTGDMTINGSLSNVVDITATGHISAPHIFQGGYPVLDSSNSHVDNGSVTIYNTTKYFLPTNSSGDVSVNVNFLNDVNVNGSLYAHDVSTDYLWANGGHITDLDASAISAKDITTEYLTVTKKAHFFSLIIDEIKSVGGQLVISPANATIDLVETLSNGDYRCYFRAKDKEGRQIHNQFDVDDQVVCQTFDVAEGVSYNVSNKYYWRKVVNSYTGVVTKTIDGQEWDCHYIDISATDYDTGSDIPEAGDKIAQLGNRTDTQRQDAIIISAYDSQWLDSSVKAPSFVQYKGINSYNLSSFRMNMFAANGNVMHGTLIVESGDNIEDLIDNVTEGLKPYPHVAYSNSSSDWTKDQTRAGEGWLFIGICFNYTESDSDLTYNSYRWMRMKGVDGQGIVDQHEWYLASSQSTGVTVNDNGWSRDPAQQQMTPTLKYLWNYEEYILTDGSTFNSTPHITGVYGEGHKVQDVSNYYLATPLSDGVTIQTAGWSENSATEAAKLNETVKYFWNYEVIHYTNGESTTVAPHISFVYSKGEKGDKGDDGSIGADGGHYEFIYKNAKTQPTAPTAGTTLSNLPTGWSSVATTPDFANGYYTWCSMCYVSGTGTYGTWSTPYRTTGDNGAKGEDGNSTEFIYKVTTTPTTPTISYANSNNKTRYDDDFVPSGWTDNPSGVDASSMYEWVASRVKESGTWSNFSSPAIWAKWGEKGEDGDGYEYIYILSETTPTISYSANNGKTKDDDDFVPTGWSDDPLSLSSSNPIEWVAKRKKSSGTWGNFSEPKVWAHWAAQGSNGGHYQFAYKNASTQPTKPTAGQTMTQAASDGWAENPSSPSDGQYTWMTQTFVSGEGTYGTWTDAVRITGAKGKDGEDGEDGSNGTSIEFIYTRNNTGTAPSAPATTQTDDWYGTYNGVTWTDNPTGVTSSLMYEYVSTRTKSVAGVWSAYSTPVIWAKWGEKGQDGDGYEYIFKLASSQPSISYTTNNGKTRYDDEFVPTGWYDDPQAMSSTNNIQWVAQRKKVAGTWSDFSTPVIWSRYAVDGSNGRDGSTGQNGQDAKTYSLADLGSQLIIDKDDKLYVNLTFGVLYVEGSNAQLLDSSDTPWSNVTGIKYKLNTDSSYTWLTANGSNGQFTKSRTISNYTRNNSSGAYAIVKLVINNIETDSLSLPITINPGSYYDTVGGLISRVQDTSTRISNIDGSITTITNSVSQIQQDVSSIGLRVSQTETDIDNLDSSVSGHHNRLAAIDISLGGITSTVSSNTDKLNNMSVGARNLIMNGAFKSDSSYWNTWNTPSTREIVTDTSGKKWMHIISTSSQWEGYQQNHYRDYNISIEGGKEYTISFKAYSYSGTPTICVGFHWFSVGNTTSITSQNWYQWTINTTKTTYSKTFTVPSGIDHFNVMIGDNTTTSGQNFYITDIKLEIGNVRTDWSPAPEETDAALIGVEDSISRVEQTATSLSSTVQTINNNYASKSYVQQTANSWSSTIASLAGKMTHRNYFSFNRGIKPYNNTCMLYPYEYGFIGWGSLDRIINFGFTPDDDDNDWTLTFQIKASEAVNVYPQFCDVPPDYIYRYTTEQNDNSIISATTSWVTYRVVWEALSSSYLYDAMYNGFLDFEKSNSSAIIYLRRMCLTKGHYSALEFEKSPEDLQFAGSSQPFTWSTNNVSSAGSFRGMAVYKNSVNPTSSNRYYDFVRYEGFTINDKTPYTLSFWAKSDKTNTVIQSYFYNGSWNLHVAKDGVTNNGQDGLWSTTLSTEWTHYTIHWYPHTATLSGTAGQQYIKDIIPIRLTYGAGSNNTSATVSFAGVTFQEGWVESESATQGSVIQQTANNILMQVGSCGINIDEQSITLNGDTAVNGTLTLTDEDTGFILAGDGGSTQITPQSIGTYSAFAARSTKTYINQKSYSQLLPSVAYPVTESSYTEGTWTQTNNFGTVPSGAYITLSIHSVSFRKYNSSTILTPRSVSTVYKIYQDDTLVKTVTLSSTSANTITSYTTTAKCTLKVQQTCTVSFYVNTYWGSSSSSSSSTPATIREDGYRVIGSIYYKIALPLEAFSILGYDGFASNFGTNSNVYFGKDGAYLRYGGYGLNISSSGLKKLSGSSWVPLNYMNVIRTSTVNYTIPDDIDMVVTTGSTDQNIIFPLPSACTGRVIYVKRNGSGSPHIYAGSTSHTSGSYFLRPGDWGSYDAYVSPGSNFSMFISDGTHWNWGYQG